MAGFNLSFGVGLSYQSRNNISISGGELPQVDSCFSTGTWIGSNPWLMYSSWSYGVKKSEETATENISMENYFNF